MPTSNFRAARKFLLLTLLMLAPTWAQAADTPVAVKWDPARTTAPESVAELKAIQETVKKVVSKVTPSTVAVLMGNSAGSGVIINDEGLILTAAHVIGRPGKECVIRFPDGMTVAGKSLGVNHQIDSGMVKITDKVPSKATWPGAKEGKWPFTEMGASKDLKKNQWVIALGHPGGPKKDRMPPVRLGQFLSNFQNSINTDCTLVGGDSGGPLFDLNGKVVGIHSRIGLFLENNVHVPSDSFKDEWDKLVAGQVVGQESRAIIGVFLKYKSDFAPGETERAEIKTVREKGPADKAGLKAGDIIIRVNSEDIDTSEDFDNMMHEFRPGQKLKVTYKRGDEKKTVDVTVERRPRENPRREGEPAKPK